MTSFVRLLLRLPYRKCNTDYDQDADPCVLYWRHATGCQDTPTLKEWLAGFKYTNEGGRG